MRKIIGVGLIIAAVFGLILSIGGIFGVWLVKDQVVTNLENTLGMVNSTVDATGSALVVADKALASAVTSVSALENTVNTLGATVGDTTPLIDSISKLMSGDLPDTLLATQSALSAAQSSARSIESTLRLLTAIPLLPIDPYQPTVPLTDALGDMNESLGPMTESFASMDRSLASSRGNLIMLSAQISIISRRVGEIRTSLSEAQKVISEYQAVTSELTGELDAAQRNIGNWIGTLAVIVTIILIWLALTQVGLLVQGWEMVTSAQEAGVLIVEEAEPGPATMDTPSDA